MTRKFLERRLEPAEVRTRGSIGSAAALSLVLGMTFAALAGCVAYEPVPVYQSPSTFDRSWAAALGALQDEGVAIHEQDRASGSIRGMRGPITVAAFVRTQADGRVRVEFNTTGGGNADPGLSERISASYQRRMGR